MTVSSVMERILEATGLSLEDFQKEAAERLAPTVAEDGSKRPLEVPDSEELRRILALPRRALDHQDVDLVQELTEALRTPWGTMKLRSLQALALAEVHQLGGLLAPIVVGGGKTLVSYLIPCILDAQRPILIVPAKLREKTRKEFRTLAYHWRGPHPDAYRIESYELLGRPSAGNKYDRAGHLIQPGFLERYRPDVIIMDEGHKGKNRKAAVTRRLERYLHENPGTRVISMSGTFITRSLKDVAHISDWALRQGSPYPRSHVALEHWADAIDEKVNPVKRLRAGSLVALATSQEEATQIQYGSVSALRKAFQKRMVETPGVVATQGGEELVAASLTIQGLPGQWDQRMEPHFRDVRHFTLPDGEPLADGISVWRHARELGLGFYYKWDPWPPIHWLVARSNWAEFCRETLKHNRRGLDSEAQVAQAVDHGLYDDQGTLAEWRNVKPTFKVKTVAVWLSEEIFHVVANWVKDNPGIIWTEHVEVGLELSRRLGLVYYGREGMSEGGKGRAYIEDHPKGSPLIASVQSNSEGRNLQYKWSSNLILSMPPNGKASEQLLGRTHRPGQEEEEVTVDLYYGCGEHIAGYHQARADARMEADTTGQDQKMAYADWVDFPESGEGLPGDWRWRTGSIRPEV